MADVQIVAGGTSAAPLRYTVPGAQEIFLKTLYAEFDGSGAGGAYYPTVRILSPAGKVVGEYRTQDSVPAGDSAHVTWGPFLGPKGKTVTFPRNMGELGFSGDGTQSFLYDHYIQFEDVQVGDGILVSAQAPSRPAAPALFGTPSFCSDAAGNIYNVLSTHLWEASPANVNEGAVQTWFYCSGSVAPLVAGTDWIEVLWSRSVFDRSIYAWLVRHDGGVGTPALLGATADNDAAVFASTQVTLTSPAFTPTRDNGMAFDTIFSAKVGGTGGFGGVAGYTGYFQALSRSFAGSKQSYRISPSSYGANALIINEFGQPPFEIDLGQLSGGVAVGAFNGVAQNYTAGANAWKGITLWEID